MSRVSVIVPVYNGERYLEKCIASILGQTHADLELILIDDGSRDNSGKICDSWSEKDARIQVIHQENQGVSAARNAGLEIATGDYIGFVDADDEIAPETYEAILQQIGDCNIAMWDAITVWGDGRSELDTISLLEKDCVASIESSLMTFVRHGIDLKVKEYMWLNQGLVHRNLDRFDESEQL